MAIQINQVGYYPKEKKTAVFTAGTSCELYETKTDQAVWKGTLTDRGLDAASGDQVRIADFTDFDREGSYYFKSDAGEVSCQFKIRKDLYRDLKQDVLKAFYYQRCGCGLSERYAGEFAHACCHTAPAAELEHPEVKKDVSGGWHDAGDYGRYTTAAATALAHMLYAYLFFKKEWEEPVDIPESGNGVADLLNECRYELEWLFKMQREDGGVYHKVTSFNHANFVMPEEDKRELYLFPVSTVATADFAAVMALSARVFEKIDASFAGRALQAAKRAWKWCMQHPDFLFVSNPEGCNTGEYDDTCDTDERAWAAAELLLATGDQTYTQPLEKYLDGVSELTVFGWSEMAGFIGLAVASDTTPILPEEVRKRFLHEFEAKCADYEQLSDACGYEVALGEEEYTWGSNMTVAMRAMLFAVTDMMKGEQKYRNKILSQMDYLLGKNAVGYSYVTGYGEHAFSHPHNRPTVAMGDKKVMKGFVSGGANSHPCDEKAEWLILPDTPPMKCYRDIWECYSLNEITIYWNSPLVFLTAYLEHTKIN